MGGFGWHNSWPFEWGGGETDDELVYAALQRAVGEGGYAKNEDGIDGLWRQCKAQALASLGTFVERAALQAFPDIATDHLPVYEARLRIVPRANATDQERRAEVVERYTASVLAAVPELNVQLTAIDGRASILHVPRELSSIVQLGKAFEPQDGTPTYGPRKSTAYPNYASDFVVTVLLGLGGAPVPGPADQLVIARIKRFLRGVLPTWVDFQVVTGVGFILDLSPLDVTAMT